MESRRLMREEVLLRGHDSESRATMAKLAAVKTCDCPELELQGRWSKPARCVCLRCLGSERSIRVSSLVALDGSKPAQLADYPPSRPRQRALHVVPQVAL